ncbi:MAG: head-tail connector protein [Pseudomonadota bacterium]
MKLTLVTAPVSAPLTRDEVKAHCRVDHPDEDVLIDGYINAAVAHVDGYRGVLGRCLINQTWRMRLSGWAGKIALPFPDVSDVAIRYRDAADAEQTLDSGVYELVSSPGRGAIRMRQAFDYPALYDDAAEPVTIDLTAGFGANATDVPWTIKQAMLLLIAHWYEHREAASAGVVIADVPKGVDALLMQHRCVSV